MYKKNSRCKRLVWWAVGMMCNLRHITVQHFELWCIMRGYVCMYVRALSAAHVFAGSDLVICAMYYACMYVRCIS